MKRVALFVALVALPALSYAQWHGPDAPDSLSFQGRLTDTSGDPVGDGNYEIRFRMYKGSTQVWEQTHASVPVTGGVFNVILSGTVTWPLDTVAFNEPIDLGIKVGTDAEMSPRTPLTAAAYALGMRGIHAVWAKDGNDGGFNVIAGVSANTVAAGVAGATISGGGRQNGVGGYDINYVSDSWGTVSGGLANSADLGGAVGGGFFNIAGGSSSAVGGGAQNNAGGDHASIGGGLTNQANAESATVGGGSSNMASGSYSVVAGGSGNSAAVSQSSVLGGASNTASGVQSVVAGGELNVSDGLASFVGGGSRNKASGTTSSVPGGFESEARGESSFAAGYRARAKHRGSFVWNNFTASEDSLVSTGEGQFLIRATGGVGIGTNAPARMVHMSGNNAVLRIDRDQGAGGASILLHQYAPGAPTTPWNSFVLVSSATSSGVGAFEIRDLGTGVTGSGSLRMKIDDGGNVGIGTSSPKEKLHVNGDIYTRGHLYLHAFEGDGSDGTAYVQARDDASSTIDLRLRTYNAGSVTEAVEIQSDGKVGLMNTSPAYPLEVGTDGTNGGGAHVTAGGVWTDASSRTFKTNFEDVNAQDILERLAALPIATWEYKDSDEGRHMGPVAEDFHEAFGLGDNERYISGTDARGVSMAAIQGLYKLVQDQQALIVNLTARLEELENR